MTWTTEIVGFRLVDSTQLKLMTAGEYWYVKNARIGNQLPRGKLIKNGKKRFHSRTWQIQENKLKEFLPE